jgi:ankyrin repeat protein
MSIQTPPVLRPAQKNLQARVTKSATTPVPQFGMLSKEHGQKAIVENSKNNPKIIGDLLKQKKCTPETLATVYIPKTNNPEVVKLIATAVKETYKDIDYPVLTSTEATTILHSLVSSGQVDLVETLLEMGANPKKTDNRGRDAFYWAKRLKSGISPQDSLALRNRMQTALSEDYSKPVVQQQSAPSQSGSIVPTNKDPNDLAAMRTLLRDYPNQSKRIAQYYIQGTSKPEVVQLIANAVIEEHGSVDSPIFPSNKATMLHGLVSTGQVELVKTLLQMGANPKAMDNEGKTPSDWVERPILLPTRELKMPTQDLKTQMESALSADYSKPAVKPSVSAKPWSIRQAVTNYINTLPAEINAEIKDWQEALGTSRPELVRSDALTDDELNDAEFITDLIANNPAELNLIAFEVAGFSKSPDVVEVVAQAVKKAYGSVDGLKLTDRNLTMLHLLAIFGKPELAKVLMDMGADPNQCDTTWGRYRAFDWINSLKADTPEATKALQERMLNVLSKGGTIQSTALFSSVSNLVPSREGIKGFVSTKTSNAITSAKSWLPAMPSLLPAWATNLSVTSLTASKPEDDPVAVRRALLTEQPEVMVHNVIPMTDSPEVVKLIAQALVRKPDNLEGLQSERILSLLHTLVQRGKPDLVKVLIDMGADPKQRDASGKTAFDRIRELQADNSVKRQLRKALLGQTAPDTADSLMQEVQTRLKDVNSRFDALKESRQERQKAQQDGFAEHAERIETMSEINGGLALEKHELAMEKRALAQDLQAAQQTLKTKESELKTVRQKLEKKTKKLQEESNNNEALTQVNRASEKALRDTKAKVQELEAAIAKAKQENAALKQELRASQTSAKDSKSRLDTLTAEKQTLNDQVRKSQETYQKALKEAEASREKLQKSLEEKTRSQQTQSKKHDERIRQLETEHHKALQNLRVSQTKNQADLRKQLQALQQENQTLQADLTQANEKQAKPAIDLAQFQQAQADLQLLREQYDITVKELQEAKQAIEAEKRLKAEAEEKKALYSVEQTKAWEDKLAQAEQTAAQKEHEAQQTIMALQEEWAKVLRYNEHLEYNRDVEGLKAQQRFADMHQENQRLHAQVAEIQRRLDSVEIEKQGLQEKLAQSSSSAVQAQSTRDESTTPRDEGQSPAEQSMSSSSELGRRSRSSTESLPNQDDLPLTEDEKEQASRSRSKSFDF